MFNTSNPTANPDQQEVELELSDQSNDSDEEGIAATTTTQSTTQDPDPEFTSTPLHQPMPTAPPGRPCLKRTNSASPVRERGTNQPSSSTSNFLASGRRSASEGNHSNRGYSSDHSSNGSASDSNNQEEVGDNSSRFPFNCSFAAPRRFCSQKKAVQQVRFETSPQAYLTHSSTNYDRTPIKCTKGSELDLSMPPRCSKREESDEEADDEAEGGDGNGANKRVEDEESDRMRLDYFGRWANLKRGTIICGIKNEEEEGISTSTVTSSKSYQDSSSSTPTSATSSSTPTSTSSPNSCALPFRGVRSFGGLCSKQNTSDDISSSDPSPSSRSSTPPPTTFESLVNDDTPMPSPSVRKSLAQPFKGSESGRQGQFQSIQSNPSSYFDLAKSETDIEDFNGRDSESGTETVKEEQVDSSEGEPIRMRFVRVSRVMDLDGGADKGDLEEESERDQQIQPSSLLSACDLDWTLVSSTSSSSRNGSPHSDRSPIPSSRSSRSNSREETEPLSAESCSEIEAVRQMLRRHALSSRSNENGGRVDGITSPPLSPLGSEDPSIQNQTLSSVFSQPVNFPITPAAEEAILNSFNSPTLKKLSMLSNSSETDSNGECSSSPISFLSSNLSTSNSISSFSSVASSPMSSRSSSLENWMNPILLSDSTRIMKREVGEDGHHQHHQRFLDPGVISSCNTSINGSLSDDTNGTDSPPTNDSSSATSPELLPIDHPLYHQAIKNDGHSYGLIERLNTVQRSYGKEEDHQDSEDTPSHSNLTSPTLDQLDDVSPPSSSAGLKNQSKSSSSTKKKGLSSKCKARKEREKERERERVRELLGEDGDCLGGF